MKRLATAGGGSEQRFLAISTFFLSRFLAETNVDPDYARYAVAELSGSSDRADRLLAPNVLLDYHRTLAERGSVRDSTTEADQWRLLLRRDEPDIDVRAWSYEAHAMLTEEVTRLIGAGRNDLAPFVHALGAVVSTD